MKKLVSVVLVLVMLLALGAVAFADSGIVITKNPTNEYRTIGGTAWFISGATGYETLKWYIEAPDGTKYSVQEFRTRVPYATVEEENTTTLTIRNLSAEMNGWDVYCTFSNKEGKVATMMAFMYVSAYVPQASNDDGYVPRSLYAVDGYDPFADDGYVSEDLYAMDGFDPFA